MGINFPGQRYKLLQETSITKSSYNLTYFLSYKQVNFVEF